MLRLIVIITDYPIPYDNYNTPQAQSTVLLWIVLVVVLSDLLFCLTGMPPQAGADPEKNLTGFQPSSS